MLTEIFEFPFQLNNLKLGGANTDFRDTYETQRLSAFQGYANLVTSNIQRVVEFAKRVPGKLKATLRVKACSH